MDGAGTRIGEGAAGNRQENPVVGARVQRELEDAEGGVVAHFTRRQGRGQTVMCLATGSDGELANSVCRISHWQISRGRAGLHRRGALVDVIVAIHQDVDTGRVEVIPKRLKRLVIRCAGAVPRLVPDGDHVLGRMRCEIGLEPYVLRRTGVAPARDELAFAI